MRVLIGDNALNQLFLSIAVKKSGFDDVIAATTAGALIDAAASRPDLIIFDPLIEQSGSSAADVIGEMLRFVPRTRLIVVSASLAELERARAQGILAARKRSFLRLQEIEDVIAEVTGRLTDEIVADHKTQLDLGSAERGRIERGGEVETGGSAPGDEDTYDWQAPLARSASANAPVPEPPVASTCRS